jgi:hypothetical protein
MNNISNPIRITVFIEEYYDRYSELSIFSPESVLREVTQDLNELINHILTYVVNQNPSATFDLPEFMQHSLKYLVNDYAGQGGIFSIQGIIDVRRALNKLVIDYAIALSAHAGWYNHHIRFITADIGRSGVVNPSLAMRLEYGESKLSDGDNTALDNKLTPHILGALEMMVHKL